MSELHIRKILIDYDEIAKLIDNLENRLRSLHRLIRVARDLEIPNRERRLDTRISEKILSIDYLRNYLEQVDGMVRHTTALIVARVMEADPDTIEKKMRECYKETYSEWSDQLNELARLYLKHGALKTYLDIAISDDTPCPMIHPSTIIDLYKLATEYRDRLKELITSYYSIKEDSFQQLFRGYVGEYLSEIEAGSDVLQKIEALILGLERSISMSRNIGLTCRNPPTISRKRRYTTTLTMSLAKQLEDAINGLLDSMDCHPRSLEDTPQSIQSNYKDGEYTKSSIEGVLANYKKRVRRVLTNLGCEIPGELDSLRFISYAHIDQVFDTLESIDRSIASCFESKLSEVERNLLGKLLSMFSERDEVPITETFKLAREHRMEDVFLSLCEKRVLDCSVRL